VDAVAERRGRTEKNLVADRLDVARLWRRAGGGGEVGSGLGIDPLQDIADLRRV